MFREHRGHPEGRRFCGNRASYPAATDDAELLAAQLGAEHEIERPARPPAAADQAVSFGDAPRKREQQRPGQLRRGLREHVWRVRDRHTARLHGRDIDVVVADGHVGDDLQLRRRVDDGSINAVGEETDKAFPVRKPPFQVRWIDRLRAVVEIDIAGSRESGERG